MTYKSKDKSFFDEIYENEIKEVLEDKKEDLHKLEKKGKRKFLRFYDFGTSKLRAEVKRRPAQYFFLFITSFLGSIITSSVALFIFTGNLITEFAPKPQSEVMSATVTKTQDMVKVEKYDPLLLASKIRNNEKDFILIDIRSKEDYEAGHILKAVNFPVFGTNMILENGDLNASEIKMGMSKYLEGYKLIILYGQNSFSTIPSDIASLLNERFSGVKPLAIGYEEWVFLNK